jgi:transglutaminase-like putative cysteine protease
MSDTPRELTIRCGLEFAYAAFTPTPMILLIQPRLDPWQHLEGEQFAFSTDVSFSESEDMHGNIVRHFVLPVGRTSIRHDAFIRVSSLPENCDAVDGAVPVAELSADLLRYTLPSRYCDSDRLMDFAFEKFGQVPHGLQRVQAICDWVHNNIEYRFGAGSPFTAASEIIAQGYGVCRDFAHTAIALCRCFNIPARYVTGYVPDVAFDDPGSPMDFHA